MKLNNRIIREIRENFSRYLGLFLLITLSVMIIVGYSTSTDSIIYNVEKQKDDNNLEDGHLTVYKELDSKIVKEIESEGIILQSEFYVDYELPEDKKLRVFEDKDNLNLVSLVDGDELEKLDDVLLDQHFSEINDFLIGDTIKVGGRKLNIVGCGISPEYIMVIENREDMVSNHELFGVAYVSHDTFNKLDLKNINYSYAYKFEDDSLSDDKKKDIIDEMQSIIKESGNILTDFYKTENNPRVNYYKEKITMNKNICILLGIIMIIMIAYMIAITISHIIERESAVIGTLYSMGYLKKEIIRHYMLIPLIIVTVSSLLGYFLGLFVIKDVVAKTPMEFYNFPTINTKIQAYLIVLGIVIPILITISVNYFVLNKNLKGTILSLLRKETKSKKTLNISLTNKNMLSKFKIRIFSDEIRNYAVIIFTLFFSVLLLVLGFGMKDSLGGYPDAVKESVKNEYTYYLRSPYDEFSDIEKVTDVKCDYRGNRNKNFSVVLRGIDEKSDYIDLEISEGKEDVYISTAFSEKFKLDEGDLFEVKNQFSDEVYRLKVKGVVKYDNGLYIFMSRKYLNELSENSSDYFNVILSDDELDIPDEYLFKCLTLDELEETADNMVSIMRVMIVLLIGVSIIISIISVYLVINMIINRNYNNISLIKIFGYNNKEINHIFLDVPFYVVIFGTIIGILNNQFLVDGIWAMLIASIQGFIPFKLNPITYLYVFMITIGTYLISTIILRMNIRRISFVEILKNRD